MWRPLSSTTFCDVLQLKIVEVTNELLTPPGSITTTSSQTTNVLSLTADTNVLPSIADDVQMNYFNKLTYNLFFSVLPHQPINDIKSDNVVQPNITTHVPQPSSLADDIDVNSVISTPKPDSIYASIHGSSNLNNDVQEQKHTMTSTSAVKSNTNSLSSRVYTHLLYLNVYSICAEHVKKKPRKPRAIFSVYIIVILPNPFCILAEYSVHCCG